MNKLLKQFNIIPVSGKKPAIKWQEYTTRKQTDEERNKFISNKEIGIVTGKVSGIFVLDDDGGLNGQAKKLPKTLIQKTPRGGTHYLFNWVPELDNKITTKLGVYPKVDTRGDGGYIKYYGFKSLIPGVMKIADPPQWLIDLLPSKEEARIPQAETNSNSFIVDLLDNIEPGNGAQGRTPTFVKVINILKKEGMTEQRVLEYLTPWAEKYEYTRLEYLVKDQYKRYPQQEVYSSVDDEVVLPSELLKKQSNINWLIHPYILSTDSLTFIAGLPKACKSWMLMDLALALSTGTEWLGKFPCKRSRVIYLDQERSEDSAISRFNSLIAGRNINPKVLDENLLIRPKSRVKIDIQNSYNAFERLIDKFKPDIILIDSLKKFHSKNELSSQDMQIVLSRIEELKDKFGCAFVFVHHETKGVQQKRKENFEVSYTDAAGTVDLPAAADHFFNVLSEKQHATSTVYHTANNHGETIDPFLVKVEDLDEGKSKIQVVAY